jgi:phosphomannomutase
VETIMEAKELTERVRAWIADDPDPATRVELENLLRRGDLDELHERFRARLEFGTAGLRGALGAGPGRMNRAVVRRVTAGLARYLLDQVPDVQTHGVVVGRDGRHMSKEFAEDTAAVLAAAGIPAHVFADVAPTPLTAYAVGALGAAAAVMVTASHNPPADNGYKVYWSNGAQIIPPHDAGISAAIDGVSSIRDIPLLSEPEARARGLWRDVPSAVGESYLAGVLALRRHPECPTDLTIVYSPLHGVGGAWVRRVFAQAGFSQLRVVPEQAEPDGDFPTVAFPNPEEKGAMDLALDLARREGADLILANDPDADRLAAIIRDREGVYRPLTGNQIGTLLAYYVLTENVSRAAELVVITSIVSSSLLRRMAGELGVHYAETLTGFKWIANKAMDLRTAHGWRFAFGFEEALGYTVGELVRDKDGIGAALVFADLAAFCRARGETVLDYLEGIHRRFGLYASAQRSVTLPGSEGVAAIGRIMEAFRGRPPEAIGGSRIVRRADLSTGEEIDCATGTRSKADLPPSNVIVYELDGGSRILLRPSGTEPKIKYYFEAVTSIDPEEPFSAASERGQARLDALITGFLAEADARALKS